ncbi:uncharacterized protein LOC126846809 [Adelges cooleyi]|uniref:uncharacterized protein LOC126846809 n=1 Tax=Adelges cooleyi TaxID=133065 RepID=UPI00217FCC3C|nr:uncharacterized protein LOC126846809 [Adelges cooleyi]
MYLSNIVLFFCVTIYFTQCQGFEPTPDQAKVMNDIVAANLEEDGTMEANKLITVINEVARALEKPPLKFTRTEDINLSILFSKGWVKMYALRFVTGADQNKLFSIENIVRENMGPDGIKLDKLKTVLTEVAKRTDLTEEFPNTFVWQRRLHLQPGRIFTLDEVHTLSLEFVTGVDEEKLMSIKNIVAENVGPDGINLDKLKAVLTNIAIQIDLSQYFPSIFIRKRKLDLKPNRIFTFDEVHTLSLALVSGADEKTMETIKDMLAEHGNFEGLNTYENINHTIDGVKRELEITDILLPSYEIFQGYLRSLFLNSKLTVGQIEKILTDNIK